MTTGHTTTSPGTTAAADTSSLHPLAPFIERVRAGKPLEEPDALRGAKLLDQDLAGANLGGADLRGVDLSRANLTKANLVGAKLEGAILYGATLDQAEFLNADLRGADLTDASANRTGFGRANLEKANLFNTQLAGASFTQSNLTSADLRAANLTGARLRECRLDGADLSRSILRDADLRASEVSRASFEAADLRSCKLGGLRGAIHANWIGTDIADVDFCGAYLVRRQILDQNYLHEFRRQSRTAELIYWVWWATSDCGRSFVRWGLWTALIAMAYAVAYQFVDIDLGGRPHNWMTTTYFSVVTLTTLGYGDIVPLSAFARIITLSEVVIGYVMLGGLLGIFANKMARRAE